MNGWSNWTFRRKLFSVILMILVFNIVVLLFMGSTLFEKFYLANKEADLTASAKRIQIAYEGNSGTIYDEISQIENENAIVSLLSIKEDNTLEITYHSRAEKLGMHPWGDRPNMPKPKDDDAARFQQDMIARLKETGDEFRIRLEGQSGRKNADDAISLTAKLDDNVYLMIQTPRDYIKSTADLAVKYTALLSIAILVCGAILIYFLVGKITRPLRDIQGVADKISRMDFSERCPVTGGDEVGKLATSINNMSSELQSAIGRLVQANEVLQNDLVRQQQTDRMRQQFIANVSHDFKTPLTLMISYAEALAAEEQGETGREYCSIIIGEGNKLSGMVGRLLSLSKLESGVEKLQCSMFCLSEILDEVIKNHHILTERCGCVVERKLEEEFIVNADYAKIGQVVTNLFENAVKYAPPGGRIMVTASKAGAGKCRVAVENTGDPIAEEDLNSLFDSFYRADKSRTAGNSYGLGLAIVRVVMEAHEQLYGVENIEGGVRFWFELPLADMGEEEA